MNSIEFPEVERPPRIRHKLGDAELEYDNELMHALRTTLQSGKAIVVPLARFHSSPAKGRLWADGLAVRHRVLSDREHVAAWVEDEVRKEGLANAV